jgi:type II secretory pathway component GspD/PulD (secretin)
LLVFDEALDRKEIQASDSRFMIGDISWSPDSRSILLTIAAIVSDEDEITQPDVYRLDLPPRFVDASASRCDGPPMGRGHSYDVTTTVSAARTAASTPAADAAASTTGPEVSPAPPEEKPDAFNLESYVTEVIRPQHMTVAEAVQSLMSEYGDYFTVNASRNVILFKGPPRMLAELKSDLGLIDTPPPHILVDLLAVELSDEANRDLGLDWTYAEGHFAFFQPGGNAIRDLTPDPGLGGITTFPGVGQAFYQGVGTLPREFFVRLSVLVKDGEGTILANPRTVATSGVESSINIRKTLNYFFNEGFDVAGRPVVKKSDISSDTIGRITPTLLPDGRIHLVVDVKVGTFTFTQEAGLPELTTRESATEVTVEQGETIVIGGLREEERSNTITKVPLLGDLPLLGFLFKHQETQVRHNVLTIFITPQVLDGDNLRPDWLQLDPREHRIVPIMKDEGDETY